MSNRLYRVMQIVRLLQSGVDISLDRLYESLPYRRQTIVRDVRWMIACNVLEPASIGACRLKKEFLEVDV